VSILNPCRFLKFQANYLDAKHKFVRFAHNWNNGMLELWNDGFKEKIKAHIFALIL
jgi:hypothetical protein